MNVVKRIKRELGYEGWKVTRTNGGHLQCMHPDADTVVFYSSTPSDQRSELNLRAKLRRALKAGRRSRASDTPAARAACPTRPPAPR